MIGVFGNMILFGAFLFLGFGIASANSIEAANNKRLGMIMTIISFGGCLAFLVGLIGVLICKLW
jgi:amino acid transporter